MLRWEVGVPAGFCNCSDDVAVLLLFCYKSFWAPHVQELCVPHMALNGTYFRKKHLYPDSPGKFLSACYYTKRNTKLIGGNRSFSLAADVSCLNRLSWKYWGVECGLFCMSRLYSVE